MSLERWMPGYIEPIYGPSTYQAYYTNNRIYKTWDRPVFSRIQWSCIDLDAAGNVFVGTRVGLNYYAEVWKQAAGVGPIIYVGSILTSSTGVTSVTIRTDGSVYAATEYSGIWKWTAASGVFTYVAGTELPPRDGGTVAYWTLLIADTSGNIWGLVKSIVNFTQVTWLLYKQTAGTGPFNYSGPWDQVSPIGGRRMPTPGTGFAYTANGDLYYTSDGWWEGSILGITSGGSSNLVETCPRYWQQGIARGNCMHLVTTQDILVTDLSTTLGGCPMLP